MLRLPSKPTLKKYGITLEEWLAIFKSQGEACGICRRKIATGRYNVDHEHVKGWKKMPAEDRKKYIRGLLCFTCNYFVVPKSVTVPKLKNAVEYLTHYEERRASESVVSCQNANPERTGASRRGKSKVKRIKNAGTNAEVPG